MDERREEKSRRRDGREEGGREEEQRGKGKGRQSSLPLIHLLSGREDSLNAYLC